MAPLRPLALVAALLLSALAGCVSDGNEPAAEDEPLGAAVNESSAPDAAPPTDDGSAEAESMGHLPHLHDYWDGKTRVVLFDGDIQMEAAGEGTFANAFIRQDPALGAAAFELPEGKTVFEGTGELSITATWSDATITSLAVGLKPPSEIETRQTYQDLEPLTNGEAFVRPVAPEETDLPHEQSSRWGFHFAASGPGSVAHGTAHLLIEIVKVRDIGLFPGHPVTYADTDHYVLADKAFTYEQATPVNLATEVATGEARQVLNLDRGVPVGTRVMTIDILVDEGAGQALLLEGGGMDLLYRGADSVRYRTAPHAVEGNLFRFAIPVADAQADSPYAEDSVWRVGPIMRQQVPGGDGGDFSCSFCVGTDVSGHALISAYAEAPEGLPIPEPEVMS